MPTFPRLSLPVGTFASLRNPSLPPRVYKLDGLNWESLWRKRCHWEKKKEKEGRKRRKRKGVFLAGEGGRFHMILICLGGHWIKRCYGAVSPPPRPAIFFQPWKGNRVYLAPWIIYFSARISTGLISNIMPGCVFGRGGRRAKRGWFLFAKEWGGWAESAELLSDRGLALFSNNTINKLEEIVTILLFLFLSLFSFWNSLYHNGEENTIYNNRTCVL